METNEEQKKIIDAVDFIVLGKREFSKEAFDEFQKSLKPLGVFMYEAVEGSDTWIIALSKQELDEIDLKLVDERWDELFSISNEITEELMDETSVGKETSIGEEK